ncbi:hypothetical protein FKW77_008435 [Venturia effusa]|uniref:Uncharacterized protein n=1 Tax=Venturia effusa TaxID=50376 RepID=A0A517LHQ1_9PEZI|nr:hypothetical protein FKW77_008435 [Venturia effusa]
MDDQVNDSHEASRENLKTGAEISEPVCQQSEAECRKARVEKEGMKAMAQALANFNVEADKLTQELQANAREFEAKEAQDLAWMDSLKDSDGDFRPNDSETNHMMIEEIDAILCTHTTFKKKRLALDVRMKRTRATLLQQLRSVEANFDEEGVAADSIRSLIAFMLAFHGPSSEHARRLDTRIHELGAQIDEQVRAQIGEELPAYEEVEEAGSLPPAYDD